MIRAHVSSLISLNSLIPSCNSDWTIDPFWNRTGTLTKHANAAVMLSVMAADANKSVAVVIFGLFFLL
jgi:hypothetical protein